MSELERVLSTSLADGAGPRIDARRATELVARAADREDLLDVAYAVVDSPLGPLLAAATAHGLARLAYLGSEREDEVLADLARRLSPRVLEAPARLDPARRELEEYFSGTRRSFGLAIDWALVRGFGRAVLAATAALPYGTVASYREMATAAGSPRANRAAGNALGANPIPIVVPCHRILRTGGGLGGYTGGLDRKRFLLGLEGALPPGERDPRNSGGRT